MNTKLSDYVFRFIADLGVKHVFVFPGGGAMHLVDSLGRCRDIEYVCNLHEQACAIAAEAYSRITNNLGVALVTTGPGGTNAITGVAGAWLDSTPCLFLSGQVKRADMMGSLGVRQLGVQELDIVSIVKSITKYAITVIDPATIRYHLEKAVYLAKSGRPGPVWIDIPLDVQAAMIDPESQSCHESEKIYGLEDVQSLASKVTTTIKLLNAAERPVIVAGNGIRLAGAQANFLSLVEKLGIPILTASLGRDLIPYSHELLVGKPGALAPRGANFALQNSDLLLAIGTRLDMATVGYAYDKLARGAKKIVVDIDPAEIAKIKPPVDVPIHADAKEFIKELLRQIDQIRSEGKPTWVAKCRDWKNKYPVVLPEHCACRDRVSMYAFADILSNILSEHDIIVPGSSGNAIEIFLLVFRVKAGQRLFHTRGLGAMGFGLPASIGACLASERKRTISVEGDGGFQLNIQELETLARLKLPIKMFVINNQGYASIRSMQRNYFEGRLVACDASSGLSLPDNIRIARAYGLITVRISDQTDLESQIRHVLDLPGPVICEVMAIPDEIRAPHLASIKKPDGSMISKPLEDLWPFLDREEFLSNMVVPVLED